MAAGEFELGEHRFELERGLLREFAGGLMYRASKQNFSALRGLAVQGLHLKEQLDYCIEGKARVGIVGPEGDRALLELSAGDISFVPRGYVHWIENMGEEDLRFLVVLSHEEPETIELSETLAGTPADVLATTLSVPTETLEGFPTEAVVVGHSA
jgi:oxalate decarboxylase